MPSTLLSIISKQALPTLHFIKQFREPDSLFIFISTIEMEDTQATQYIIEALSLPLDKCRTVIIDANDAAQAKEDLAKAKFAKQGKYLINLTGGNKLMSQMVFQQLQFFDADMFYAPIGSSTYQQLYPEIKQIPKKTSISISLKEYLEAYGFEMSISEDLIQYQPSPKKLFQRVLKTGHPAKVAEIATATDQEYKELDKNYLMGTWFEWYLYDHFKQTLKLAPSQIAFNVGIKRKDNPSLLDKDNEFDVMFIYQNDLYVFECKVYPSGKLKTNRISQPLFKLSSLTQNFGLQCKKYFAYLGEFTEDSQAKDQLDILRHNLGVVKILEIEHFRKESGKDLLRNDEAYKIDQLIKKFNS
ncbi:Card1-like endonuclease domain-containing protein [Algoriphagus chordae]|uniref:Uncharacterized protein DUF1887 n=1 Tax=Algoriphagus chordae TaxID=237019 RepID=A0A2W7RC41_9BACT|nr:DUF1887 family CARF protein [Algoriphagus chordae]PZX48285.1 uncharacterized protein DUF1887 [Algoriphagus chordae]